MIKIQELFNATAERGAEYRIDFDGTFLPNGMYIYRLITNGEVHIEKFIIAH